MRALLQEDIKEHEEAMSHLWSAIVHQGTPWTATGPAALVVAGLLTDEQIDLSPSLRAELLLFLICVAEASEQVDWSIEEMKHLAAFDINPFFDSEDDEALYENENAVNAFYARSILGCIEATPVLMQVMLEELTNASPRVRACAAMGAVTLIKIESLRHYAKDIELRLLALARSAQNTDERSSLVLALGDLGFSPIAFLEDPSPGVRMCAALTPSLAANTTAIDELLNILEHHAEDLDRWFVEKPPQFLMRPRFRAIARLIQQIKDFDRLVNAAIAVVGITEKYCVDNDWGPLLATAFSDGSGIIKTEAQRRFLSALVENKELWDSKFGNPIKWFKQAGLPYDREVCAKRVERLDLLQN